jgi:hypothetical protein
VSEINAIESYWRELFMSIDKNPSAKALRYTMKMKIEDFFSFLFLSLSLFLLLAFMNETK